MIEIGKYLLCALFAGLLFWFMQWVCGRLNAPAWLTTILSGAVLVYFFWLFSTLGPITIGR